MVHDLVGMALIAVLFVLVVASLAIRPDEGGAAPRRPKSLAPRRRRSPARLSVLSSSKPYQRPGSRLWAMAVERTSTTLDRSLITEADDLASEFYEIACDDLEPEAMRLLALDAAESFGEVLDALTARGQEGLSGVVQPLADRE